MAIEAGGYADLRQRIIDNWNYIEVRDEVSEDMLGARLEVDVDPRVTVISDATENPVSIEIILTGSDDDITLDSKVKEFAIFDAATDGNLLMTQVDPDGFTFADDSSQATFTISINIPSA